MDHQLPEDAQQFFRARLATVKTLIEQMQGAVAYYCETHGLEGQWQLSEDGARLIPVNQREKKQ